MIKLKKFSVLPMARLFCGLHAFLGAMFGLVITIGSLFFQEDNGVWQLGPWALLIFPAVNACLGFLTGLFLAWSYNSLSRWLGGIEVELASDE